MTRIAANWQQRRFEYLRNARRWATIEREIRLGILPEPEQRIRRLEHERRRRHMELLARKGPGSEDAGGSRASEVA